MATDSSVTGRPVAADDADRDLVRAAGRALELLTTVGVDHADHVAEGAVVLGGAERGQPQPGLQIDQPDGPAAPHQERWPEILGCEHAPGQEALSRLGAEELLRMSSAFEPLSRVEFRYERLETNPRFAAIARPSNAAVRFRIRIDIDDRGGLLEILMPYATLEPVRDLLLQMFMGEKFGRDSIWETHLARQLLVTAVELEALLDEQTLPLGEIMRLTVGSTLSLNTSPDDQITLCCGQVPLLRGRVGRQGDHIAIRIPAPATGPQRRSPTSCSAPS
jgi:hypothetical protein